MSTGLHRESGMCMYKPRHGSRVKMAVTVIRIMRLYEEYVTQRKDGEHFGTLHFCALVAYFTSRLSKSDASSGKICINQEIHGIWVQIKWTQMHGVQCLVLANHHYYVINRIII